MSVETFSPVQPEEKRPVILESGDRARLLEQRSLIAGQLAEKEMRLRMRQATGQTARGEYESRQQLARLTAPAAGVVAAKERMVNHLEIQLREAQQDMKDAKWFQFGLKQELMERQANLNQALAHERGLLETAQRQTKAAQEQYQSAQVATTEQSYGQLESEVHYLQRQLDDIDLRLRTLN